MHILFDLFKLLLSMFNRKYAILEYAITKPPFAKVHCNWSKTENQNATSAAGSQHRGKGSSVTTLLCAVVDFRCPSPELAAVSRVVPQSTTITVSCSCKLSYSN